jgi:hypothetical protein
MFALFALLISKVFAAMVFLPFDGYLLLAD